MRPEKETAGREAAFEEPPVVISALVTVDLIRQGSERMYVLLRGKLNNS